MRRRRTGWAIHRYQRTTHLCRFEVCGCKHRANLRKWAGGEQKRSAEGRENYFCISSALRADNFRQRFASCAAQRVHTWRVWFIVPEICQSLHYTYKSVWVTSGLVSAPRLTQITTHRVFEAASMVITTYNLRIHNVPWCKKQTSTFIKN